MKTKSLGSNSFSIGWPVLNAGLIALLLTIALRTGVGKVECTQHVLCPARYFATPLGTVIISAGLWALTYSALLRLGSFGSSQSRLSVLLQGNSASKPEILGHDTWQAVWVYRLQPLGLAIWLLPMLGFLGTVIGISAAIGSMSGIFEEGVKDAAIPEVLEALKFAFDTTFLGLSFAIVVMIARSTLQAWVDRVQLVHWHRDRASGDQE